jgi:hypothetical protein
MLDDVENVGIMQGFLDEADDAMEMEDEMEEEEDADEENSAAKVLDRRPNSPEILMNNLRGDMRSVDARREELADLVGYPAAAETPDSVLAMLQPVLAQGAGLGALPQSQPMAQGPQPPMPPPPGAAMGAPPPGAPPLPPGAAAPPPGDMAALLAAAGPAPGGGMAPGPMMGPDGQPIPPEGMPPIQMKDGGYVQRFYQGSGEEGVTSDDEEPSLDEEGTSSLGMRLPPELLEYARTGYSKMLTQPTSAMPDLKATTLEREQMYRDLLGEDKESRQAQLLLMLGQKGLQLAGNVDAQGRPLRGSTLSRLATVASEIPGAVGQFIAEEDKNKRAIRMAAIQAAEKEREQVREGNIKLVESQRKAFGDILKNSGKSPSSMFGKGSWDWSVINAPGLLQAYADGETTPEEDNLITSAASRLLRPSTELYTNELGQKVTRTIPGYNLPFLTDALAARRALDASGRRPGPQTPGTVPSGPNTVRPDAATGPEVAPPTEAAPTTAQGPVTAGERAFGEPTIWQAAQEGIGFVPKMTSELARRIPFEFAGEAGRTQQQAASTISKLAPRVAIALRETTRLAEAERQDINMYLNLEPRFLENRVGYLNNLISLGQVLYRIKNDALTKAADRTLDVKDANDQRLKAREVQSIIDIVGIPPVVSTREEYIRLPLGAQFLVYNREKQAWVPDTRKPLPDEQ